jgi:hypothetical protein
MPKALSIPAADFSPLKLLNAGDRTSAIWILALAPSCPGRRTDDFGAHSQQLPAVH